jgi:hypothetical protein
MTRRSPGALVAAVLAAALALLGGGLLPRPVAAVTPDPSDVVLVFDFSASILDDAANRNRFAAALTRLAARVDETSPQLITSDATVSIVQFATRAADVPTCADLKLLDSPTRVGKLADCLRAVANAYGKGTTSAITKRVGSDTNYVAAMEEAARHLPADAIRPAMILFTDGKHDVAGVPVSEVQATLGRLFGTRTPFALLPVGMGLRPAERNALAAGLERLRVIRDMPACISGATFAWPQVVFETADQAGTAVAVALQDATCTFTAAPTPPPTPSPSPAPTPAALHDLRATPGDGKVDLAWRPVVDKDLPVVDYTARCRAGEGEWIESKEGVSLEPRATVDGLANGTAYACEVAAVAATGAGSWTPTASPVTPIGRPPAPAKPTVEALNGALRVSVPAASAGVLAFHYECSNDGGATWVAKADAEPADPATSVTNLTNGVAYTCRAFAENTTGVSDASAMSDAIRPCNGPLDCTGLSVPIIGGLGALLLGGILLALFALYRGRTTGYVLAVVDVVHSANIGHGSSLGIAFERDPVSRAVTGIVSDRGSTADVRIRRMRGGKFAVQDRSGRREVADGDPIGITDGSGGRHSLVLRAFDTNAASRVATRR